MTPDELGARASAATDMARRGDVEGLRRLVSEGALEGMGGPVSAAVAILPLVANAGDRADATAFIKECFAALGVPGTSLSFDLLDMVVCEGGDLVALFDVLDPSGWVPMQDGTARTLLGHAYEGSMLDATVAALRWLARHGREPVCNRSQQGVGHTIFQVMMRSWSVSSEGYNAMILSRLKDLEIPSEWSLHIGREIMLAARSDDERPLRRRCWMPFKRLMSVASYPGVDGWMDLLSSKADGHGVCVAQALVSNVGNALVSGVDTGAAARRAIARAIAEGVRPDDVEVSFCPAALAGQLDSVRVLASRSGAVKKAFGDADVVAPWLCAAIVVDDAEAAAVLLEGGADPGLSIRFPNGASTGVDGIGFAAMLGSEKTLQLLQAKSAKGAVGAVLSRMRGGSLGPQG